LYGFKDEGIMFYYGRPVRRVRIGPRSEPNSGPFYAALREEEWTLRSETLDALNHPNIERMDGPWVPQSQWELIHRWKQVTPIHWLRDQQGDPFVLVRVE
jgi:hypothetical protein